MDADASPRYGLSSWRAACLACAALMRPRAVQTAAQLPGRQARLDGLGSIGVMYAS